MREMTTERAVAMPKELRALIVEDSEDDALLLIRELEHQGYAVSWTRVQKAEPMRQALAEGTWDVVLSDYSMPRFSAPAALGVLQESGLDLPFIVISGTVGDELGVETMKAGAHDYLMKGNLARLGQAVQRELREAEIRREHRQGVEKIRHLNRVLRAVRSINRLIVRETDPQRIVDGACERLVSARGYDAAWIVLLGAEGKPGFLSSIGFGGCLAEIAPLVQADELPACLREALSSPGAAYIDAQTESCAQCPINQHLGAHQTLAARLEHQGETYGVMAVHLRHDLAVDDDERELFLEIASDIAFGLQTIETDQALVSETAFIKTLFDAVPDTLFVFDPTTGRAVRWNEAFRRLSGYTDDEIAALPAPVSFYSAEELDKASDAIGEVLAGGTATVALGLIAKDGQVVQTEYIAAPLAGENGGAGLIIAIGRDITEQQSLEEQLRQAQKMESVGRLAGGVAHDFNNLLTIILGSCTFLTEGLAAQDPMVEDVHQIFEAGKRAERLTRQLLAFSRSQPMRPEVLDLNGLLGELHQMISRLIGEDIGLITLPCDDLWPVQADRGHLEQVIMNLAINARDAMPDGGRLTIEAANVDLAADDAAHYVEVKAGAYVMLAVSDNGHGMDAQTQRQIFDPFFTTKPKDKGTGLGLSTVYGIVRQHGGSVRVYSEPGVGTTFRIYLPRTGGAPRPRTGLLPSLPTRVRGSETVLIVEDDPAVREVAVKIITRLGYDVLEAADGPEAWSLSERRAEPIHLLLTDVILPGPSGMVVATRLVAERPKLRVLYMSGYTDNAIVHHGVLDPGIKFVEKPFTVEGMARAVRDALDDPDGGGPPRAE